MNRIDRSIDNLLGIIDELQQETAHYGHRTKGGMILDTNRVCDVIRTKEDLIDYISNFDNDYIVFITPGHAPVYIDREVIDKLTETGELAKEIDDIWKDGTIAAALP